MSTSGRCAYCRQRFVPSTGGRRQIYCSPACRAHAYRRRQREPAYFQSETPEWATPLDLFERLDAEHHFTLDVCATAANAKCERFFTRSDNGLEQVWEGTCWMNPPYGRSIGHWVAKAVDTARAGHTVVALLPVRTDTTWWQRFVVPYGEVEFIKGRLRFNGAGSAPFPSAVVGFRDHFRDQCPRNASGHESP
jgi:phage N-6-adenine-methyltransferase